MIGRLETQPGNAVHRHGKRSFMPVVVESSSLTLPLRETICCPTPKAGHSEFSGRCLWTIRSGSPTASWIWVWVYSTAAIPTVNHCATTLLPRLRTTGIVLARMGPCEPRCVVSTQVVRPKPGRITDIPTTDCLLACRACETEFFAHLSSVTSSRLTYS